MNLIVHVSEWCFVLISSHFVGLFSPKYTANRVGPDGAAQIAKALQVNTTLSALILGSN